MVLWKELNDTFGMVRMRVMATRLKGAISTPKPGTPPEEEMIPAEKAGHHCSLGKIPMGPKTAAARLQLATSQDGPISRETQILREVNYGEFSATSQISATGHLGIARRKSRAGRGKSGLIQNKAAFGRKMLYVYD